MIAQERVCQAPHVIRVRAVEQKAQIDCSAAMITPTGSRRRNSKQCVASGAVEWERFGQATGGARIWLTATRFEVLNGPDAEPSTFREGSLGQSGIDAVASQENAEQSGLRWRARLGCLEHRMPWKRATLTPVAFQAAQGYQPRGLQDTTFLWG
jgi:hypothetical protein